MRRRVSDCKGIIEVGRGGEGFPLLLRMTQMLSEGGLQLMLVVRTDALCDE